MAQNQNKSSLMRIVIPVAVALVGALMVVSLMTPADPPQEESANQPQAAKAGEPPDGTPAKTGSDGGEPELPASTAEAGNEPNPAETDNRDSDAQPEADTTVAALADLRAAFPDTPAALDEPEDLITLGSFDKTDGYEIAARINPYRAAIYDLTIVNEYHRVDQKKQYKLLSPISFDLGKNNYPEAGTYAAQKITINGQSVPLARQDPETGQWFGHWQVDKADKNGVYLSLTIIAGPDEAPIEIARIDRRYRITDTKLPKPYTVQLEQQVVNLTDQPMTIQWEQVAQGGIYHATNDYLRGRSNQYVLGHFDLDYDPAKLSIYVKDEGFLPEPDIISKLKEADPNSRWQTVWPNPKVDRPETKELAWLASENRYFVAITSPHLADLKDNLETGDIPALQAIYPTVTTTVYPNTKQAPDLNDSKRKVILGLISQNLTLASGQASQVEDLSVDLFAGPREDEIFAAQPYQAMHFDKTIRYSLGGMCGFCTFQWLANLLLSFLDLLHMAVFDWGVAIIILVLVVRICLHPLTKRGQINMMKMGKQMAAVQPELNKLKKKYADDPKQMQSAQMQLFREKGINPAAGALGCLPMLLQMPIWIALYAMLYYAIELRHEPAFFGIFQMFAGWEFLADLSSADRFIPLFADDGQHVWELIFIRLDYSSINILPILMGVTFFINMKFTTPPPMNEQQATQQKVMKIMPLLFPFFLYSAPAGLTLYICASTLAGIVDSTIVRKHVREMEESGELFKPKPRKPGGLMDKLQKAAEAQAMKAEEMKKQQAKNKGPQNYKKRKR